ncbi:hypothetical protein M6B38_203890 [Iris pallida]|uniref:Uncharacterized protein n=1 Tax=Iris pallida TaxID=29817 RepID=A0AAX6E6X8_IRIPA|nr:hypothetical protein M6B38_203890 [Iris pallida]
MPRIMPLPRLDLSLSLLTPVVPSTTIAGDARFAPVTPSPRRPRLLSDTASIIPI